MDPCKMEPKPTDDLGSLAAASFPLLVYDHGEQPENHQTMLSVADGTTRTYRVPELRGLRCLETQRGLLLTVDTATLQASLWNPQTGETIPLPAMDEPLPEACRCVLSDTVSSPDCLVLVYDHTDPELLFCHVNGGDAWTSQSYDIGVYDLPESYAPVPIKQAISEMAAVQGRFYIMEVRDEVGVLSFARHPEPHLELTSFGARMPTATTIVRDMESEAPQDVTLTYLVESSQELFLVCLVYVGCNLEHVEEVGAYRMDFSRKEWCKVTDIGDRAFLLGPSCFAASCSAAEHGLRRGCVYFAFDVYGDSNDYHIFDLQEGTRELAGPPKDVPLPARQPFWMVPVLP